MAGGNVHGQRFGALSTSLQNANFGLWRSQANGPRQMQMSLKLYW